MGQRSKERSTTNDNGDGGPPGPAGSAPPGVPCSGMVSGTSRGHRLQKVQRVQIVLGCRLWMVPNPAHVWWLRQQELPWRRDRLCQGLQGRQERRQKECCSGC